MSLVLPFAVLVLLYNFDYMDVEPLSLLMASLPLVAVMTSIYQLLYELISDLIAAISTSFVCMLSMAYLSGVFYPANFFTDRLKVLIEFLPINLGLEVMRGLFLYEPESKGILLLLCYTLVDVILSIVIRRMRILKSA